MIDLSTFLSDREWEVHSRREAGMTYADIAAELGITANAVGAMVTLARKRILSGQPAQRDVIDRALANEPRCARCQLRGHVAGDPVRCLRSISEVAVGGRP